MMAKELAFVLWPHHSETSAYINYNHLLNRTKRADAYVVQKIVEVTGVDANFLFNINQNENR